jgi:hypothetical protein
MEILRAAKDRIRLKCNVTQVLSARHSENVCLVLMVLELKTSFISIISNSVKFELFTIHPACPTLPTGSYHQMNGLN